MWVLKSTNKVPPGSFPYVQTEGIYRKFPAESDLNIQAHIVLEFRLGNGLPRATIEEVTLDIILHTCERLGNMKKYCFDTEGKPYVAPTSKPASGCGGCGAKIA